MKKLIVLFILAASKSFAYSYRESYKFPGYSFELKRDTLPRKKRKDFLKRVEERYFDYELKQKIKNPIKEKVYEFPGYSFELKRDTLPRREIRSRRRY